MQDTGRDFMEQTKHRHLGTSDQMRGIPQPPLEMDYAPEGEILDLPEPRELVIPPRDLRKAIEERRSVRQYARIPLSREELAYLLWCTQGVKSVSSATFRTVPSAGARHAFETFLLINSVRGFASGLYRYLALEHKLLVLSLEKALAGALTAACLEQDMIRSCAVVFVWVAVPYRMTWRYGERGYRYLHLDAGHVCQNLYLAAGSVDCGVCGIAAYSDDEVNKLLGLDGNEAFAIYLAAVGKKR